MLATPAVAWTDYAIIGMRLMRLNALRWRMIWDETRAVHANAELAARAFAVAADDRFDGSSTSFETHGDLRSIIRQN